MHNQHEDKRPVAVVAIGAGNRASKYIHYVVDHPEKARLVGVVEPNALRRENVAEWAGVPPENCFPDLESFFASPIEADAVVVCTPDETHYQIALRSLDKGYHVLLEKPIARSMEECEKIAEKSRETGKYVVVCHVLHFHPYFVKLKELVDSGRLGKVVSISHQASVGTDRTSHGFVRGVWNREETSNPMILSKCCHDLDLLVWLTGSRCKRLSSYGSLGWFRKENAPEGSADRCIRCKVEKGCPYSAVNLYRDRKEWIANFDVPEGKTIDEVIDDVLENGVYGRCVYRCDNDVVDRQVVAMEMENGATVTMSMDCFTLHDNRRTHICLTHGEILGDETTIEVSHFRDREVERYDFSDIAGTPFHAGADLRMMENFVEAVADPSKPLETSIEDSIESHRICFKAEEFRKKVQ